jgi:hypothetical protein
MWYQRTRKLKRTKQEKKEILVRRVDKLSKLDLFKVEKYNIPKNNGSVTKKMYIPDSLWVIEENADIGNLIFLRSIYTGLWFITF